MKLFTPKDPTTVAGHELREARLHLLQSDAALEHYQHTSAMLRQRITRLEGLTGSQPATAANRTWRP